MITKRKEKSCLTDVKSVKQHSTLKKMKARWQLYVFMIIPLVYALIFLYYPMTGIQLAFKEFDTNLGIWGSPWIGLEHFKDFVSSYMFWRLIKNTLVLSFYGLIAGFPIPIIFALALNAMTSQKYKKIVQTVTYLPHFISVVVMVGIVLQILNPATGLLGVICEKFGVEAPNIMGDAAAFKHIYVWSGIWQSMGWSSIIYIAALSSVDTSLYEAAAVDGASRFKQVIYIDFPCIIPTAIMLLIMNAGAMMNVGFEKVFLLQNDLNMSASEVISTYVYKIGLTGRNDFGYATAISLFNSIINLILIVTVNTISSKLADQSLW